VRYAAFGGAARFAGELKIKHGKLNFDCKGTVYKRSLAKKNKQIAEKHVKTALKSLFFGCSISIFGLKFAFSLQTYYFCLIQTD
jgi:hypothetical protein